MLLPHSSYLLTIEKEGTSSIDPSIGDSICTELDTAEGIGAWTTAK
jgi:hypothetical protein